MSWEEIQMFSFASLLLNTISIATNMKIFFSLFLFLDRPPIRKLSWFWHCLWFRAIPRFLGIGSPQLRMSLALPGGKRSAKSTSSGQLKTTSLNKSFKNQSGNHSRVPKKLKSVALEVWFSSGGSRNFDLGRQNKNYRTQRGLTNFVLFSLREPHLLQVEKHCSYFFSAICTSH